MKNCNTTSSRRNFLGKAGAAAAALPLAAGHASAASSLQNLKRIKGANPRNVIYILSDDHRYDFMGFLGKPAFLETPNMDRMARDGAYIEKAFVTTSLCSPSRCSILTGQFSHHHGVVDNQSPVKEGTVYFPQYLQQAGYKTAFIGKWHMGHEDDNPRDGFDHWASFRGQGDYYNPTLNINGKRGKVNGYVTDILTGNAIDWLDENKDNPFFLYLSHKAVHAMFKPAERHLGRYNDVPLEYPESMANTESNYRGKPRWVKEQRYSWHGVDYMYHGQLDFDSFYRRYCETLLGIDDSIGKILTFLETNGLLENTLVMYMGDNGFCFGEHGLIDKRHAYEESMRVPFLAHCPDMIKPGTVIRDIIQNIDVAETVLEAAGLEAPDTMDGMSFLPLLEGRRIQWRDCVFYEYYWERNFPQTPTVHAVRTNRYKYMHYHGIWDIDELYDLSNDPHEMYNLIDSPEHQDIIRDLNKRLFDWLENTDGMKIPLRPDRGGRRVERKLH